MVNMDDVAAMAGVSKATVSRVFNGNTQVAEDTRKKVFAACDTLNYKINSSIQDLVRKGKSGYCANIAFVLVGRELSDPAYAPLLDPIAEEVDTRRLHLMLVKLDPEVKSVFDLPPVLRDNRVDGIFITGQLSRHVAGIFEELGIPTLIIGCYSDEVAGALPQISLDLARIYGKAIDQAFVRGAKKLALVTENHDSYFSETLLTCYRDGLKRNGCVADESLIYWQSGDNRSIYPLMKPIFMQKELPFDAIIALESHAAATIINLSAARYSFDKKADLLLVWTSAIATEVLPEAIDIEIQYDQLINYAFELMAKLQGGRTVPYKTII